MTEDRGSLLALYRHAACGSEWPCWWSPEAVEWPLFRGPGSQKTITERNLS